MRVYNSFTQAKNEITRDLNELGIPVRAGYQSKSEAQEWETQEFQDMDYRVTRPRLVDLTPTQPWCATEWDDRLGGIMGHPSNPGNAYTFRANIWAPLLEHDGKFSYTYSERLADARVGFLIEGLRKNLFSRQIYISIWNPDIDSVRVGYRRVPCSLGYQLMFRNGALDMSYHMRSSDFITHWDNDVWLAVRLQQWIADELEVPYGTFTHKIGSFHAYTKDIAHAF